MGSMCIPLATNEDTTSPDSPFLIIDPSHDSLSPFLFNSTFLRFSENFRTLFEVTDVAVLRIKIFRNL